MGLMREYAHTADLSPAIKKKGGVLANSAPEFNHRFSELVSRTEEQLAAGMRVHDQAIAPYR